jgi:hypothetical protein
MAGRGLRVREDRVEEGAVWVPWFIPWGRTREPKHELDREPDMNPVLGHFWELVSPTNVASCQSGCDLSVQVLQRSPEHLVNALV